VPEAPSAGCVPACDQGHTNRGQGDLKEQLDPVDAVGAADIEGVGDERPDDGGGDADQDREPDRDGLSAWEYQATEGADDESDDDGAEDADDGHVVF
jgi:hypothetical protein